MKRVMIMSAVFLMSAALFARESREREQGEVAAYLQLTAAQQTAWENARADFRTASEPLFERWSQIGHDIEAALKSKSADACSVGNMMIASQAVSDQIKAQKESLQQKLESVLTPDQKTKYEAFQAAQPRALERRKIGRE